MEILVSVLVAASAAFAVRRIAVALAGVRSAPAGAPHPSSVFRPNPEATSRREGEETVLGLRQQKQGLALNGVASRCWELMDGRRTLRAIARQVASEHGVPVAEALAEIRGFARRLAAGYYALPRHDWEVMHTHAGEPFAGTLDEGIAEEAAGESLIIHRAAGPASAVRPPWAGALRRALSRKRRAARALFAAHLEREAPLRGAAESFDRGWRLSAAGDLGRAREAFLEAARQAPGWANPFYQLGYVHLRARRYADAVKAFCRAEELSPGFFMVREYLELARQLASGSLRHEAFHFFEKASTAEPGDPDRVIDLCRRALELSPDFPPARVVLGRAYARKRDYARALDELRRAIDTGPGTATLCHALCARGSIFMARGMQEQALREFQKVIDLGGSPVATRSVLAHLASSGSVH
ncbi:MAG TPA: PqqD family peptide modification chaperone [Candidatus Polarisedimenticolia bacterium]|nr:PqqD family peptide modification chaperone [Candidatus Polarisedimenticolia bacterium]